MPRFIPNFIAKNQFLWYNEKIERKEKNDLPPIVISKEDRIPYFEYLRNTDNIAFANWLREISLAEEKRMKKFEQRR